MEGIRRATGKQEPEAAAAAKAELEHTALAPKAQPCGGTGGEEPEVGRGWPPSRWSPAVHEEAAGSCRAEKQVTEGVGGGRVRAARVRGTEGGGGCISWIGMGRELGLRG
jgi:hypothetical protein